MAFDLDGARQAGYSDEEIAGFLASQRKFDLPAALESGYSAADVIGFLSEPAPSAAPAAPSTAGAGRGRVNPPLAEPTERGLGGVVLDSFKRGWPSLKQNVSGTALRANAGILEAIDRVEKGIAAGKQPGDFKGDEDPYSVAYMTPEQRAAFRAETLSAASGNAGSIVAAQAEKAKLPAPAVVEKVVGAKTWGEALSAFAEDPVRFVAAIGPESLVQSAPGLVGAAVMPGGAAAKAATMGLGSTATDYGSNIIQGLQEAGVDLSDPAAITAAAKNPELMRSIAREAMAHAGPVGAVDAASAGVASKLMLPGKVATHLAGKPVARELANVAAQVPVQGALGGAGEALGEIAAGQELQPGQILAEIAGESFSAPADVAAVGRRAVMERLRGESPPPATPATPAPRVEPTLRMEDAPTTPITPEDVAQIRANAAPAEQPVVQHDAQPATPAVTQPDAIGVAAVPQGTLADQAQALLDQTERAPDARQPDLPEAAGVVDGAATAGTPDAAGGGRDIRPVADDARGPVADAAAPPAPGSVPAVAVRGGSEPNAALTTPTFATKGQALAYQAQNRVPSVTPVKVGDGWRLMTPEAVKAELGVLPSAQPSAVPNLRPISEQLRAAGLPKIAAQVEARAQAQQREEQPIAAAPAAEQAKGIDGAGETAKAPEAVASVGSDGKTAPVSSGKRVAGSEDNGGAAGDTPQRQPSRVDDATGLPLNDDGTVTLYHHTSAARAAEIRRTGELKSAAEPDVYVTTRPETDTGYGDTAVPVQVDPARLQIDDEFPDGRKDFRLSVGKPGGSLKVIVPHESRASVGSDATRPGAASRTTPAAPAFAPKSAEAAQTAAAPNNGRVTQTQPVEAAGTQAAAPVTRQTIELRKRRSVLESLMECLQ